jgi:hypothetical protein
MLIARSKDRKDILEAEKVFDTHKIPYDSVQVGSDWFLSSDQPKKAIEVLKSSGLVGRSNPKYFDLKMAEEWLRKNGYEFNQSIKGYGDVWSKTDMYGRNDFLTPADVIIRKLYVRHKNPILETIIGGLAGGAGLAAGFVGVKKLMKAKNPTEDKNFYASILIQMRDKLKGTEYLNKNYSDLTYNDVIKWNLRDIKMVVNDLDKSLFAIKHLKKNPNLKISHNLKTYLSNIKADKKAGHTGAQEYWEGAAAGALIAENKNPEYVYDEIDKEGYGLNLRTQNKKEAIDMQKDLKIYFRTKFKTEKHGKDNIYSVWFKEK